LVASTYTEGVTPVVDTPGPVSESCRAGRHANCAGWAAVPVEGGYERRRCCCSDCRCARHFGCPVVAGAGAAGPADTPATTGPPTAESVPRCSGVSAKRVRWNVSRRAVAFADLEVGEIRTAGGVTKIGRRAGAAKLLAGLPADVNQVFLCGPRPGETVDHFRRWAARPADQGFWSLEKVFDEKPEMPVVVYGAGNRRVELHRAASWFGEGGYRPAVAWDAWHQAANAVGRHFEGQPLLATPAGTGRYLWAYTIPWGREWDCLAGDDQELIRATAGQGRVEACPTVDELPGLVELDGRFMYGALCAELGAGPAIHDTAPTFDPMAPGRYRVRFRVPDGWGHVGLLGVKADTGWWYPAAPGWAGETWADGAELHLAAKHGWPFEVVERVVLAKGDPLGGWAKRLLAGWAELDEADEAGRLARRAVRSILVKALGGFVGRDPLVTVTCPADQPGRVPADAIRLRQEGDQLVWAERAELRHPEWVHPEWPARVWARARARLLAGPGGVGALGVDRGQVVAMETDALYLTADPGWADDGRPGRFRVKAAIAGPITAPRSLVELHQLKRAAGV
jgi:hypothetical protein